MFNKKDKKLLANIHKDIDRKFDSIININIQNFSINGTAIYNDNKCFFKIVDEEFFIKEINGYLISYKKIPTMEILFIKRLFQCKKYLIAYTFDNTVKESIGLLNDAFVNNDLNKQILEKDYKEIRQVLNMYNDVYSSQKEHRNYCPSNVFFEERINTRLKKWYINSKKMMNLIIDYNNEYVYLSNILNEVFNYFEKNIYIRRECVLMQGDPNTLNISTRPCFFDLATAGYNPIIGELAITIISTLIYDNYFCPKYHSKSYFLHEKALKQYKYFTPNLNYKKSKNIVKFNSSIITSNVRKKYILDYIDILKKNDISIEEEIKYYIVMRLLCVFNIKKMDKIDFYYSLYLVVYFYKNINGNFYESINKIIEDMECV